MAAGWKAMHTTDIVILSLMAGAAFVAAGAFAAITRYLFDRGLADPNAVKPDLPGFYRAYVAHTRKTTGRVGLPLWIHAIFAGLFIAMGVGYTLVRFILPWVM